MNVVLDFDDLSTTDLRDAERLLVMLRRKLADSEPALDAIRALLHAIDVQRSHGTRGRGALRFRVFGGDADPEEQEAARRRLVAGLVVARDAEWLSPRLRRWLNDALVELADAGTAAAAEAEAIRALYVRPSSRNPREAA